eukprot:COSAG06_NODE_25006_length_645_cov_1.574818_2_plen_65_part_01
MRCLVGELVLGVVVPAVGVRAVAAVEAHGHGASGASNQSINPAQGQYICDTFVMLDLILKCVRRI